MASSTMQQIHEKNLELDEKERQYEINLCDSHLKILDTLLEGIQTQQKKITLLKTLVDRQDISSDIALIKTFATFAGEQNKTQFQLFPFKSHTLNETLQIEIRNKEEKIKEIDAPKKKLSFKGVIST